MTEIEISISNFMNPYSLGVNSGFNITSYAQDGGAIDTKSGSV